MPVTFRFALPADVDAIVEMMSEYYAGEGYEFHTSAARVAVIGLLGDPSLGRLWVIEEATGPAGYLVLTLGYSLEYLGRDAFVDELYVRESHRGHGIGGQALAVLESTCHELGVRAIHLEVERDNPARALYQRRGFVDHDRFLMTKRLAPRP